MSATTAPAQTKSANGGEQLALLERILRGQLDAWRRMLNVIHRQRDGIQTADATAMEQATAEQQQLARTMAMLDQQRERVVAEMHAGAPPRNRDSVTLTAVLGRIPCDLQRRQSLLTLAADLRDTIETAKKRSAVVRAAADALARHMAGIQQSVHSALGRARVYERRGRLDLGVASPAAVDMRS